MTIAPDLNQVVLQMICENQAGIPLWMKAMSGNSNDSSDFRETIKVHLSQLKESVGMSMMVADSALYAKETLNELGDFGWISRVPETIGGVSKLCQMMAAEWSDTKPDRAVKALGSTLVV